MNPEEKSHHRTNLLAIYLGNLLLSLHYFLVVYVNSSLLEKHFSTEELSVLYIFGSVLSFILFLFAPRIIKRTGNYHFLLAAAITEGIAIAGMAMAQTPVLVGLFFLIHQTVVAMVLLGLDIFLEITTDHDGHTGQLRGTYLTLTNIMLVIAPSIVGILVIGSNYGLVYTLSALLIIPFLLLVTGVFSHIKTPILSHVSLLDSYKELKANKNILLDILAHYILQAFYAWMIIYTPIYLHRHIGFEWDILGILFTIMLLPFVLFELPVGKLADEKFGEKEFMTLGFFIMSISAILFLWILEPSFIAWALVLFLSRVGASFVEITTESYFFKQVSAEDSNLISLFRASRPAGSIIAPLIGGAVLIFLPYRFVFLALAVVCLLGIFIVRPLKDTR